MDISEIIKDRIYLSGIFYSDSDLKRKGIKTIINVSRSDIKPPKGVSYFQLPLDDSIWERRLIEVAKNVYNIIEMTKGHPILIHCEAGISRAPSVIIYYLMKKLGNN